MASGLLAQTQAAGDGTFQQRVRDAIIVAAVSIYNEATVLSANIKTGTANAAVVVSPALGSAIATNTVIRVGNELFMCAAGASSGATSIPTTTTAAGDHFQGEAVSPPTVPAHLIRANHARQILNNPDAFVLPFTAALASQGLDTTSTDTAINNGVSSIWNPQAGA